MTFPKPWEQYLRNNDTMRLSSAGDGGLRPTIIRQIVPPLPPRPLSTFARQRFQRYNGFLNGGYGDFGSYFPPYPSPLYGQQEFENRYIQMAEESAQPAFDSIEAFVRGFSSVTMMLESTFQAMNMSFRAILGVAENMSKVRAALIEFLSSLAIFKTIYAFYRKILHFLGLVNRMEANWNDVERTVTQRKSKKRRWPILAFLAAIIVGPTLVYKYMLPDLHEEEEVRLLGLYDFDAEQYGELSFAKGDVMTAKRSELKKNWIKVTKSNVTGVVPYNRVRIIPRC